MSKQIENVMLLQANVIVTLITILKNINGVWFFVILTLRNDATKYIQK